MDVHRPCAGPRSRRPYGVGDAAGEPGGRCPRERGGHAILDSMEQPSTEYARFGEVSLAYQVVGEGPIDLVFVPPFVSHCELIWEIPEAARMLRRLASFSRLVLFD